MTRSAQTHTIVIACSHSTSNLHRFAAPIKPRCFKLPWPSVSRLLPYSPCLITDDCLFPAGEKRRTTLQIYHSLRPCQGRELEVNQRSSTYSRQSNFLSIEHESLSLRWLFFSALGPTSTLTSLTVVVLPSSFRWALIDRQTAAYLLPGE